MEEYSDEALDDIQTQSREWGEQFFLSRYFIDLTQEQQEWAEMVISAFSEMMYIYHGRRPQKWTVKTVEECCTITIPRKVSVDGEFFGAISPVLAAYFEYLNSVGHIRNGTALIRAIKRKENAIANNAEDPENWGMAKSIISMAQSAGVDFSNKDDLNGFINQLNSGELGELELPNLPVPGGRIGNKKRSKSGYEDSQQTILGFATKISKDLAMNKPPSVTNEMKTFLDERPQAVFDLLILMVNHFEEHKKPNNWLVTAFLGLMGQQLEEIRYAVDRQFEWANALVEDFQNEVVELAFSNRLPPPAIKAIMDVILDAKLKHSPGLLQAHDEMLERSGPEVGIPTRDEFVQTLHDFIEKHENDPFGISDGISDLVRYMPKEGQSFMIGEFLNTDLPGVKDAVALLTLNPEGWIRKEALQWLLGNAKTITQTALRRLIVIRNWIPEDERKILDQVTKAARKKGVECAQWTPGEKIEKIQSSQIDGVGAQGFMLVTKPGAKYRFSSVLVKQGVGIADAWSTPVITKRKLSETLRQVEESSVLAEVSDRYLEATIRHYIQVGLDAGVPPQIGLLEIAEMMEVTGWLAQRLDFQTLLEEIINETTGGKIRLGLVEDIIQSSAMWGDLPGISDSWFEESQEIVEFFQNNRSLKRDRLIRKVLADICEPNRQTWAEKFTWMAFWYSEQPKRYGKKDSMTHHFAFLARELYTGRPMTELPLMEAIARRTIAAIGGRD